VSDEKKGQTSQSKDKLELSNWYYISIFLLVILSLFTFKRDINGAWEIAIGLREINTVLVALAILPVVIGFLRLYEKGEIKLPGGIGASWERKSEIDKELAQAQEIHHEAGKAATNTSKKQEEIESIQQNADEKLISAIKPNELPFVQSIYLQEIYALVKEFNRNRHKPPTDSRTVEGDEIAYRMRAIAPLLFGQFTVEQWLNNPSPGKRLAAVKYLEWSQDIEFLDGLLNRLSIEEPFLQFHICLALSNMIDQLNQEHQTLLRKRLESYSPPSDTSRDYWKKRILASLSG